MGVYEEWKKDIENKINHLGVEKIPSLVKRCPKCNNLSLEFDANSGGVVCIRCGFRESFPIIKKVKK